jgi:CheY-like chemotaxis protein
MANRILLADDSITIQKVVNLTFADEGIEVVAVSNGDQAERRLADVQPDLVLADIFMPGKNGYELCEAIKESAQYHHIPVVLLVGAFEPFDQAEARRVKADAHLTKPFESRTLVDTVRRLISTSSQPRTGPLPALPVPDAKTAPAAPSAVAAPTSRPTPVEPRAAVQMTQPFNLDLAAMTNANPPPAPPGVLAATIPLDFSYGSSEDPLAVPIEVQVADAPAAESAFAAPGNLYRKTDDLSFGDSQPPFEALGLDELFAEPLASAAPPTPTASADAPTGFGEVGPDTGFAVPSTFGYATEEVLLDFDQATPATRRAAQEPFSFDIDERETASVDASGMQMETAGVELAGEPEVLKTTMLEPPAPTASVDGAINTNPLEMPAVPAASEASETPSAFEAPIDQSALFNVDDPLGDVLDEGPLEAMATEAPAATIAPLEPTAESLVIDAPPEPAAVASVAASPIGEFANHAPLQPEASAASWESPVDYEVEFPVEPMTASAAPDPAAAESAFEMHVQPFEPAETSETGFGFTTVAEEAEDVEPAPRTTEAKFTASSMWTNEEARFAAIDIEATPVEEMAEAAASEGLTEPAKSPVFEEDASAYITQANQPVEVAAPVEAVESSPTPMAEPVAEESAATAPPSPEAQAPAVSSTVELSPALIDEIVRRVVAQISESVVREIAWEVVPDCVERVIKEMTAQEVSKH